MWSLHVQMGTVKPAIDMTQMTEEHGAGAGGHQGNGWVAGQSKYTKPHNQVLRFTS